jgi:hypothetical protein
LIKKDITRDELAAIAKAVGLSEKEAIGVLESRTFRDAVDADWDQSKGIHSDAGNIGLADGSARTSHRGYAEETNCLRQRQWQSANPRPASIIRLCNRGRHFKSECLPLFTIIVFERQKMNGRG